MKYTHITMLIKKTFLDKVDTDDVGRAWPVIGLSISSSSFHGGRWRRVSPRQATSLRAAVD
jgi:hypothetical protein